MKIAAVFGNVGSDSPKAYVERMCKAQLACDWHTHRVFEVPGGAIGIVRTSEKFGKIPMFLKSSKGNILAVSGVPIKGGKLTPFLHRVVEMSTKEASVALTEIDGAYAALFWHAEEQKAVLVTDFMGFQPVYLHKAQAGIAIASEIKAFSIGGVVPVTPDPAGWGGFVIFGNSVGEPTQLSGVSRLRSEKLTYDVVHKSFNRESIWEWPERQSQLTTANVPLEPILDCFRDDVEAYREYGVDENTLLMSSGFDSRLLLCLATEAGIPVNSLSVQQPAHFFGAEGKLGQKVARGFGISDAKLVMPLSGMEDKIESLRYMAMNDVASPGLSLFIGKVAGHVAHLSGAIWEGGAPGNIASQLTHTNMDSYLQSRWGLYSGSQVWSFAEDIFTRQFFLEQQQAFSENLTKERALCGDDDYGIKRFIIKNRALNRIIPNPLKVYANAVLPFMPGTSKILWEKTSILSPYSKCGSKILTKRIFAEFYPKATKYPFCSEKGLYTADGRFDLSVSATNLFYDLAYKWERRHKIPYVGKYIGKKSVSSSVPDQVDLQKVVLDNFITDNTCLDPSKVKTLLSLEKLNPQQRKSKNLLVYWALWNLVMRGDVASNNAREWLNKKSL